MPEAPAFGPPRDAAEGLAYADVVTASFDPRPPPGDAAPTRARVEAAGEVRLVRSYGAVAGGLACALVGQWFGGRVVPSGAVGCVAIAPEHRGRGLAGVLLRGLVGELAERGVALSALYPSTRSLYRGAGYEVAGVHVEYALSTLAGASRSGAATLRSMSPRDADLARSLYDRRVRATSGPLARDEHFWRAALAPAGERPFGYVAEHEGRPEGYVVFTHRPNGDRFDLRATDLVATSARAASSIAALFRSYGAIASRAIFAGAPADPLVHALAERDGLTVRRRSEWMLRVVDLAAAISLRGFPRGYAGELHLDVDDPLVAKNAGRRIVAIEGGRGVVRPGGRGDLRVSARALAPLYTGYLSPDDLALAGLLEGTDDALASAAAAFAGPAPWLGDKF